MMWVTSVVNTFQDSSSLDMSRAKFSDVTGTATPRRHPSSPPPISDSRRGCALLYLRFLAKLASPVCYYFALVQVRLETAVPAQDLRQEVIPFTEFPRHPRRDVRNHPLRPLSFVPEIVPASLPSDQGLCYSLFLFSSLFSDLHPFFHLYVERREGLQR